MASRVRTSSAMESFKASVCRTCLHISSEPLGLINEEEKTALLELCNIQVKPLGVLPCGLCPVCRLRLRRMQEFILQACGAQDLFMEYLLNHQDNDPIVKIDMDILRDVKEKTNKNTFLSFSKFVILDCNENESDVFTNEAFKTYTNCIKDVNTECRTNIKNYMDNVKNEINSIDGSCDNYFEEIFTESIKVEPEFAGKRKSVKKRSVNVRKKTKTINNKGAGKKKVYKLSVKDVPGRVKKIKCKIKENNEEELNSHKSDLCVELPEVGNIPIEKVARKKELFQHFDRSMVNIIKLSVAEQLEELEKLKCSDKYKQAPYKCDSCVKYFSFENTYSSHLKKHTHEEGAVLCPICRQCFKSLGAMSKHAASHEERFQCVVCSLRFRTRSAVSLHTQKHAAGQPLQNFQCRRCSFISHTFSDHVKHQRSHRVVAARFNCPHCPKSFPNQHCLTDHVNRHMGVKKFSCPVCEQKFVNPAEVRSHSVVHSSSREFYCVECNMNFKTSNILRLHYKYSKKHVQPETLKFECEQCGRRFESSSKLSRHTDAAHLGVRRFSCQLCQQSFLSSSGLRHHTQNKHTNKPKPRNHVCEMCGKGFTTKAMLHSHVLIHTGEKPFSCSYCGTAFRQKAAMTTHIRLVHLKVKRDGTGKS